jgi:hypothetical protein
VKQLDVEKCLQFVNIERFDGNFRRGCCALEKLSTDNAETNVGRCIRANNDSAVVCMGEV